MKNSRNAMSRQNKTGVTAKPRPEIRDDLDSRSQIQGRYEGDKSKKGDRSPSKKKGQ